MPAGISNPAEGMGPGGTVGLLQPGLGCSSRDNEAWEL